MNELQVFKNQEFGQVRTLTLNDEPWFVGKDVAEALGYSNSRNAVPKHVSKEDSLRTQIEYAGQRREVTVINESGLYALIFGSKLESAQKFKRWVTSEVLPTLRKTGQYQVKELSGQELMAKALIEAQSVLAAKDKQIEEMKPKALFADAVSASEDCIPIGELAKFLSQNGIKTGRNRLFAWLRDNGYLIKSGSEANQPTQRYMEQGLFKLKQRTITKASGVSIPKPLTLVTGKGQRYFIDLFLNSQE